METLRNVWTWVMTVEIPGIVHLVLEVIGWVVVILFFAAAVYFFKKDGLRD